MFLTDVHEGLAVPGDDVQLVKGTYEYYHYGCDGVDDRGWGCGYRTLQSVCSWIKILKEKDGKVERAVPSLNDIQKSLVEMQDKIDGFIGSKQWIGSFEVCICLDYFYDVPSKIVHVSKGTELPNYMVQVYEHFQKFGSPIMMGGDTDNISKGVMGACMNPQSLLIVDPHFFGCLQSREQLQNDGWVKWVPIEDFSKDSFYNLCLPQLSAS